MNKIERIEVGDSKCRVEPLLKFLAQEWMSHIIWALGQNNALRFAELRRALPGSISARVLSARLKSLEGKGFVIRCDLSENVRHVEYSLTAEGQALDAELRRSEAFSHERYGQVLARSAGE